MSGVCAESRLSVFKGRYWSSGVFGWRYRTTLFAPLRTLLFGLTIDVLHVHSTFMEEQDTMVKVNHQMRCKTFGHTEFPRIRLPGYQVNDCFQAPLYVLPNNKSLNATGCNGAASAAVYGSLGHESTTYTPVSGALM